jgi:hypothetical protein
MWLPLRPPRFRGAIHQTITTIVVVSREISAGVPLPYSCSAVASAPSIGLTAQK